MERRQLIQELEEHLPDFIALLVNHRPPALRGRALRDVVAADDRHPAYLSSLWHQWRGDWEGIRQATPTLAFAMLGQAKMDGRLDAIAESQLSARLLTHWALRSTLNPGNAFKIQAQARTPALAS